MFNTFKIVSTYVTPSGETIHNEWTHGQHIEAAVTYLNELRSEPHFSHYTFAMETDVFGAFCWK
jgi:hypothetical protein